MTNKNDTDSSIFQIPTSISSIPRKKSKLPYGLAPLNSSESITSKLMSFESVRDILLGNVPDTRSLDFDDVVEFDLDIITVADCFELSYTASSKDWVTASSYIGYPGHTLCRYILSKLYDLRSALVQQDNECFSSIRNTLLAESVVEMLETFIQTAANPKGVMHEENLAFIAFSYHHPDRLFVDAKEGTAKDIVRTLALEHELKPNDFGLTSLWLVHDVARASTSIKEALEAFRKEDEGYEIPLLDARRIVEDRLIADQNASPSPWHTEEDRAFDRLTLSEKTKTRKTSTLTMPFKM